MKILIFLITGFLFSFQNDATENTLTKIRIAKGKLCWKCRMYDDRTYKEQIEFNLKEKAIFKRRNESKRFKLFTEDKFPSQILDSTFIEKLNRYDRNDMKKSQHPLVKDFFYKVDLVYSNNDAIAFTKTFEMPYYPFSEELKNKEDPIETLIEQYLKLIQQ